MIVLYLMGKKGLAVLAKLYEEGLLTLIDSIIMSRDKNVEEDCYFEIIDFCQRHNVRHFDRKDAYDLKSKYGVAVAWRWMIKDNIKLIVLHDSLLPKYRGFAPLVNMLIHREPYIGVTALFATDGYDKGDIIEQKSVKVQYPLRIKDAIELLLPIYAAMVCDIVKKLQSNVVIEACPQNETDATYSLWRDEKDYRIDWNESAEYIQQFIYSVGYPYFGACSVCNGQIVRILDCEIKDDVTFVERQVGKVAFMEGGNPVVVCGIGLLKVTEMVSEQGELLLPLGRFRTRFC